MSNIIWFKAQLRVSVLGLAEEIKHKQHATVSSVSRIS